VKLVYAANSIVPSRTANSIHVMKMCAAFSRNGHEVILCVPARPERVALDDGVFAYYGVPSSFRIVLLPWLRFPGRGLAFAWQAGALARRERADLLYGRQVHACFFASRQGVPTKFESHAPVAAYDRFGAYLFGRLIRDPAFRGLVVVSNALREHYLRDHPRLAGSILVAADAADEIAREPEVPRLGRLQVGYVGHLYPGRGIELIVELAGRCPWAEFHLIGGLDASIAEWRGRSADLANIVFHGFCPPSEVQSRIARLDVLLAPYQRAVATYGERVETARWMSPLKIFEYMAAGKPMVVSDLPVLREVLDDANSMLVDPEHVEGWVAALEALRDANLRQRLGLNARDRFLKLHTWDQRARAVLA
jgi:glycosyltransferase involved in cell wall biosynthesis